MGGQDVHGGSAFLRAGAGVQWVYKRFFAGVDVGWYPVELYRYGVEDRPGDEIRIVEQKIDDSVDRRRVTLSAHVGLSL